MTKAPFPSDSQDKFMLRLPDGMRDVLKRAAEANKRSMNSEIIARLTESLMDQGSDLEGLRTHRIPEAGQGLPTVEGIQALANSLRGQAMHLEQLISILADRAKVEK